MEADRGVHVGDLQADKATVLLARQMRSSEGLGALRLRAARFIRPGDPVLAKPTIVKLVTINRPSVSPSCGPTAITATCAMIPASCIPFRDGGRT